MISYMITFDRLTSKGLLRPPTTSVVGIVLNVADSLFSWFEELTLRWNQKLNLTIGKNNWMSEIRTDRGNHKFYTVRSIHNIMKIQKYNTRSNSPFISSHIPTAKTIHVIFTKFTSWSWWNTPFTPSFYTRTKNSKELQKF